MFAQGVDHGQGDVVERLGSARAAVVDAGDGLVEEVHKHLADVADIDEVAGLLAVAVAEAAFKELDLARRGGTGSTGGRRRRPCGPCAARSGRRR